MTESFKPVVTDSVSLQISEALRTAILEGKLKVNDRLPTEEELAAQFGVSRPTIREALKRLAAQHLIRSRRGPTGGTFVHRPTLEQLSSSLTTASTLMVLLGGFTTEDILEARRELEVVCGGLAAQRRTEADLEEMEREIAYQRRQDVTDVEFCASDVRFHRALADASQNATLRFLMYAVIEALQPVENMIIFRFRERAAIVDQHEQIAKAIRAGTPREAKKAIEAQILYLRSQFAAAEGWRERRDRNDGSAEGPVTVRKRAKSS